MHFFDKRFEEKVVGTPAYYEKKKENMKKNEISRMNLQLQLLLKNLNNELKDNEEFKQLVQKANRTVHRSSILHLEGRQHFENIDIAIESYALVVDSLLLVEEENKRRINMQLQGIKQNLTRIDALKVNQRLNKR